MARRELISALGPIVPPDRLEDVVLAASELVTNAVRHSGARGRGTLAMRVDLEERSVRVQVDDPGPGFDPSRADRVGSLATSGFGLQLVERLADQWGVASDGTTRVWFAVDF
ncbi:MAG TPA: ATP-binding protein [Actinomycetota bacterium]|nr:ATP-binding protein [Actinomycetota bacterium]